MTSGRIRSIAAASAAAVALALGLAVLVACSSSDDVAGAGTELAGEPYVTTLVSSPESIGSGSQRLIFQLRRSFERLGGPTKDAVVEIDTLGIEPVRLPATWIAGDDSDRHGGYVVSAELDTTGTWLATLIVGEERGEVAEFVVLANTPMPRAGDDAPHTENETIESAPLARLTTDPDPDERLYDRTIQNSIESGDATVVIFSTPKYCTTDVCGPMLDLVKTRIVEHPAVEFTHVEVYEDFHEVGEQLIPRPAVVEWGIQTEPWIFTVATDGTIVDSFEGIISPDEFDAALARLN